MSVLFASRYNDGLRVGLPEFNSQQGQEIFLFSTSSRPALVPTKPVVTRDSFPMVKRPGRDADYSPPSSVEVKNGGAIHRLTFPFSWRGA
jgi:hypothetical protein